MRFLGDVRFALRILARNPSYAAAAVTVLALGIGAVTAMFTVVRAVLLQPLPYRDADRLVTFRVDGPAVAHAPLLTGEEFFALRERTDVFEAVATVNDSQGSLTGVDDMEVVTAASVSDNYLPLLGASPVLGRTVNAREDLGTPYIRAVNVGYDLWQRRWRGDPALVGRHIEVNNIDVVVVGIMPRGFRAYLGSGTNLADHIDIWFPGAPDFTPTSRNVPGLAKLRRGVSIAAAQAAVDTFIAQFIAAHPSNYGLGPVRLTVVRLDEDLVRDVKPALVALAGAVTFVLLVACANLTNLLLARATARARELAVRRAIGASRAHVVRQLTTESVVLWLFGAAAGLLVARWAVDALLQLAPSTLPRREQIGIDLTAAAFAAVVSLSCAAVSGLIPAWHATREDVTGTLKRDPATAPAGAMTRGLLVASQLALSLMLLVGAGLMTRAFLNLITVPLGFDPSHVLTLTVDARAFSANTSADERLRAYNGAADAGRRLPGVDSVAIGLPVPLSDTRLAQRFATGADAPEQVATQFIALPGFAETLHIPLRAGRTFTTADNVRSDPGVLVDERLAASAWPGRRAVGQRLMLGPSGGTRTSAEVIGVVAHVQTIDVRADARPQIWVTYPTRLFFQMGIVVRTHGDPAAIAPAVRQTIEHLGPRRPLTDVRTLEDYVSAASADTMFALFVFSVFAIIAVVLTSVGVYGVVAYTTARRTREIAVRRALGADARAIVMLVLREGLAWTAGGVLAGATGARLLSRWLESLLFQVKSTDAPTLIVVAALLAAIALVASALPAIRAVGVDPMGALRSE